MAMVTDYDCWRHQEGIEDVTVEEVVANLKKNVALARRIIVKVVERIPEGPDPACDHALEDAIMTSPELISPAARQRLGLLIGKYISPGE